MIAVLRRVGISILFALGVIAGLVGMLVTHVLPAVHAKPLPRKNAP